MSDRWTRQRNANRTSGGGFWKPKDGENIIRVLPFKHTVKEYDFALKRYPPEPIEDDDPKLGETIEEFFAVSRRHFQGMDGKPAQCSQMRAYDGSYTGECANCDVVRDLYKGTPDEKKRAGRMKAQTKFVLVVCDVDQESKSLSIWDAPSTIVDFILMSRGKKKYQNENVLGFDGRDLTFVYNSKPAGPTGYYTAIEWMDRGQEVVLDPEELGSPPDLLKRKQYVPTVYHSLFPLDEAEAGEETSASPPPAPKKEEPAPAKKRKRKPKKEPEPDPTPAADKELKVGDTVFYMEGDVRLEGVVTDPTCDEDGFFRIKAAADNEEYDIKPEELVP